MLIMGKSVMMEIMSMKMAALAAAKIVVTESKPPEKSVMTELPTAIPSPIDAERAVRFISAEMV